MRPQNFRDTTNNIHLNIFFILRIYRFKSKHLDEDVIYLYAKVGYDEDNDELTNGKHIQLFMEDLQSRDPIDALPR